FPRPIPPAITGLLWKRKMPFPPRNSNSSCGGPMIWYSRSYPGKLNQRCARNQLAGPEAAPSYRVGGFCVPQVKSLVAMRGGGRDPGVQTIFSPGREEDVFRVAHVPAGNAR